ncbi:hypothetical protein GOBAR_AA16453 [Gossypium barbadense]|uniref:Uncharacterized protein n=1 Tax=Gossypium barbadense TaxID=3634 RepID=A0A2P5XLJ7_GOSBA|nr:hypothetical protein GOBAR_AA16453 [Gossypium barbadense]
MGETRDNDAYEEELLDYEEEEEKAPDSVTAKVNGEGGKKGYVRIHSSGFRDFLLKPELLRAIVDSGFEHPSEGKSLTLLPFLYLLAFIYMQHECIPQAILGMDVICQAKSGMGKTAVFVLSTLQQIEPSPGQVIALVLCHTRELAYQICHEFERFSTYLPDIKVAVFYGGVNIKVHKDLLKNECPHIVVGTPGRILALTRDKDLSLKNVRHFILDECDKMLESLDMRRDVQEIFKMTPHDKQVMMFSATLSKEIRPVCKKFMQDPMEIYVDDEAKLTLHGLVQHYIKLSEMEKNRKLNDLLDALDFNQVVIFVKSVNRAAELNKLLVECNFPSICIHSGMSQEERLTRYKGFKEGHKRILVATDLVGRGIDIERVNIVINYDMPDSADTYLHRVGRAGRFGTKGLAITFVSSASDSDVLNQVQERFEVDIKELPEQIDTSTYTGNGYLSLTPEPNNNSTSPLEKVGRVLYHQQVVAWPASFSTTFTIRISPFPNSNVSGDGMAFIFAQDNASSPPSSTGSYLGIMDPSTQGGVVQQLAVELDTYKNEWDPDANHIGIDTISIINPVAAESLNATGIDLKSGRNIKVRIDYHGWKKLLEISMAYSGDMLVRVLNHSIEMEDTVPSSVFVGFTAATGRVPESHHVLDWTFSTIPLPDLNNHGSKYFKMKTILLIVVPLIMGLLIVLICFLPSFRRLVKRKKEMVKKKVDIKIRSRTAANVPKMFTHKMLAKATHNFSKENLLGTGGFGSVYKGTLKDDPPTIVAVKKISATSKQGEKEYFAEICTIGRLRHKNIVQLQGWCHEGLASALLYLHEDSSNPVVHRDVKPNNVMLDEEFNAHLGDFGLARLLQNDDSVTTMLAGTPGYLAPEVGFTGKSMPESDVYSFGMVVIEVVCGRRSKGIMDENSLVDYVWNSYGQNELLNCVDPKLESEFDEEQVKRTLIVGLACLHPDSTQRPKIRKVVQIFLNPDEPLMDLPESRPSAVYITVSSSGSTTTTNIESKSAPQLPSLDSSKADDVVLQCDF